MPAINPPLSPEKWARIREIFARILEAPEEHHSALLERLCGDDPEIRMEMDALLAAHGHVGSFLEETASVIFNEFLAPALRELDAGTVLASRFHILRYIDTGGMGAVYEAWDAELQENVALKTIRPEIALHPAIIERFKKEVRQAHHVTHPNICRVYDLFSHEFSPGHREWFLTMQLLKGETLQQRLRRNGPLSRGEALELVRQLIAGLSEAHRHGIVHRDFKSGNVMLVEDGNGVRALITDFGLATDAINAGLNAKEHAGQGTPAFTAPEQWFDGTATPAADQYSLGVVMYEMLTGDHPTPARRDGESVLPARLLPGRKLDRHWERAICRCLQVRPDDRFRSLQDILRTIDPARRRAVVLGWAAITLATTLVSTTAILLVRDINGLPKLLLDPDSIGPGGHFLSEGPRFSSDGRILVYASDQYRQKDRPGLDIFEVSPFPHGATRRLTDYPISAERPTISKDGEKFAFETAGGLYIADASGGRPDLIAHNGREPSFSPDGKWILYSTGGDEFFRGISAMIYVYRVGTKERFRLAREMSDARLPLWNSDGDHILFTGCEPHSTDNYPDCKDWWVTSLTDELSGQSGNHHRQPQRTGAATVLAAQELQPTQYFGGWQDDTVVFSAHRDSQVVSLWEVKLNPRRAKVEGKAKPLMLGDGRDFIVSSSVVAKAIAICEWRPVINVRKIEKPWNPHNPKESDITQNSEFDLGPSLSHNGRFLIFTRGFTPARKIHVLALDSAKGNSELEVPSFDAKEINSPIIDDELHIAFEATENKTPLIRVSTELNKQTRILCTDCRSPSAWVSPSTQVLYADKKLTSIQVKDIHGGNPTTILSAPDKYVRDAAWSPENRYIAFTVLKQEKLKDAMPGEDDRSIVAHVFMAPYVSAQKIPEETWVEVTDESEYSFKPQWSRDGKTIYYLSKRDGNWCVWGRRINQKSGGPDGKAFEVRHYGDPKQTPASVPANGLNLAVDGDTIYLNVLETYGDIHPGRLVQPGLFSRELWFSFDVAR